MTQDLKGDWRIFACTYSIRTYESAKTIFWLLALNSMPCSMSLIEMPKTTNNVYLRMLIRIAKLEGQKEKNTFQLLEYQLRTSSDRIQNKMHGLVQYMADDERNVRRIGRKESNDCVLYSKGKEGRTH